MSWLSRILTGHGGHGAHGAHGGGHGSQREPFPTSATPLEAAIDLVTGEAVRTDHAITSLYEGKIYYFASKENRERFEAAPQQYAHKAAGHAVASSEPPQRGSRRRGGC